MKSNKQGFSKEKIFSAIISFAIILTLGYGIYSVVKNTGKSDNNNNIVNLNETENGNVAMRTEDGPEQLPGGAGKEDGQYEGAEAANAGATTQKQEETSTEAIADVAAKAKVDPVSNYSFGENDTLTWPVKGDVAMKYSMDTTVLYKTLGCYKTSPAMLISSDVGTNVGVAASGVVKSVLDNDETGTTIVVAIGGGYETTYGMLNDVVVKEGDTVVAGQLLGKVAEPSAYYTIEGSSVYFKLTKDGNPVDPALFLKEE